MARQSIMSKNIRYHIRAILDFPADETIHINDYLEHLQEVGYASIVEVELVESNTPLPRIEGREFMDEKR